jgi:hypothetical protein
MVDCPRHTQRLIVDEMDFQSGDARIGGRVGDLGLAVLLELDGSGGLARGREAFGWVSDMAGVTWRGMWNLRLGRAAHVS